MYVGAARVDLQRLSHLVVGVDLQQMWQNSLQILFYEFFCFYLHGEEKTRPEVTANSN